VLENGHVTLNRAKTRLSDIIDRAVVAAQDRAGEKLAIRRDRETESATVVTDPDRLAQVFINLIANARKYCRAARPELAIAVSRHGDRVEIDFVDNGRGIPAEAQALVFEKFARLSDHGRAGGAGLGLAICREITARLGGGISYIPGQGGAAFRVTLPADLPQTVR
jgi:signal transduction histidine kinase